MTPTYLKSAVRMFAFPNKCNTIWEQKTSTKYMILFAPVVMQQTVSSAQTTTVITRGIMSHVPEMKNLFVYYQLAPHDLALHTM